MIRVLVLVLFAAPAMAAPPPDADLNSPLHAWFERQHSVIGSWCCNVADGHILEQEDWRISGTNYQVRINGQWLLIAAHVLRDPAGGVNPTGKAVVWYTINDYGVHIYCFAPGTGF